MNKKKSILESNVLYTIIAILVGAILYVVLMVKLRGVTESEISGFPKGTLMVRILKKCRIL